MQKILLNRPQKNSLHLRTRVISHTCQNAQRPAGAAAPCADHTPRRFAGVSGRARQWNFGSLLDSKAVCNWTSLGSAPVLRCIARRKHFAVAPPQNICCQRIARARGRIERGSRSVLEKKPHMQSHDLQGRLSDARGTGESHAKGGSRHGPRKAPASPAGRPSRKRGPRPDLDL